jgi:hypothetical protein
VKQAMWVLWPSFVVAGVAAVLLFTFVDAGELQFFEEAAGLSRLAIYSLGFLFLWGFAAASSALTCFLQRGPDEINRCPLRPLDRPPGCPRRDPAACGDSGVTPP